MKKIGHELDLRNICRICLIEATESTDLFNESEESLEILKKISICFQIILNSEKYLPYAICNSCIKELDIANNFRIKCVTINERFKQHCETVLINPSNNTVDELSKEFEDGRSAYEGDANNEIEPTTIPTNIETCFKCNICSKVLKSLKSLEKHTVGMHENRKHVGRVSGYGAARRYHCTSCSYVTPHSQTLVNHMRRHNGDRPFQCECGKNFSQASSLAAHRKTHSTVSNYTCSECGKQFKHAFSLKTHLRVHAKGYFSCSVCLKVLKSKETLHAHMKRHYKVYDYNCEDCGNTFVTSAELYNHRLIHSSVKDIVCHICNYATNTKKSLLVHLKRHLGEKAFKCNLCEKSFYTRGDSRRHLRVHTREKPFACQMCAQKFTYSTSLNKHMSNIHGILYKWGDVKRKEGRVKRYPLKAA